MPRTFHEVTDLVHCWLLGAVCAYTVWAYANRALYGSARLSRMNLIVSVFVILRLLATIRLETTSEPFCSFWIFMRTFAGFTVYGLNIYFTAELFLNIVVGVVSKPSREKRLWRYSVHGLFQLLNLSNAIQHATNVIPVITPASFCAITGRRDSQPLAWLTMATFFISLAMTIALAFKKSLFSATVPQFARLFRVLTVSSVLLCVWVTYVQLDIIYAPWEDWKSFNMTIMAVWMTVNSIIANNYLISLKTKASSSVKPSSNAGAKPSSVNGTASGTSATFKGTPGQANTTSAGQEGTTNGKPRETLLVPSPGKQYLSFGVYSNDVAFLTALAATGVYYLPHFVGAKLANTSSSSIRA